MRSYLMHLMLLLSTMIRLFSIYEGAILSLIYKVLLSAFDAVYKIIL